MAEKLDGRDYGYFWNDDGSGDRTYNANSFEYWLKKFFTTGVFAGDLQVTAGGSYTVNVATGYANVNGKVREFYKTENFTVPSANSTYPRIDTIVVRRDDTNKIISLQYVTGTYSGRNPSATAPTRSGAIYELVLAEIYVGAGATEILQRDITDKRADKTVCGIVTGTVEEVDFSQFASQFNSYYNEFKSGKQADFETWFAGIQNVLDGDTAGKLYNLIQENKAKLDGVAAGADQIAQNTAQIETAGTATNAHSAGEYVMISNALYRVTASVAKGDTWTIGTNVTAANIGSEIGSLKSDLADHSALHVMPLSGIADAQNGFNINFCNVAIQGKIVLCWLGFAMNNITVPQWKDFAIAKLKSGYYPAKTGLVGPVGIIQEQGSGLTGALTVIDNAIKMNTHNVSFNSTGWCWGFIAYVLA